MRIFKIILSIFIISLNALLIGLSSNNSLYLITHRDIQISSPFEYITKIHLNLEVPIETALAFGFKDNSN